MFVISGSSFGFSKSVLGGVLKRQNQGTSEKTWCTVTVARVSVRHRGMIQHWNSDLGREVVQRKRYRAPQKSGRFGYAYRTPNSSGVTPLS